MRLRIRMRIPRACRKPAMPPGTSARSGACCPAPGLRSHASPLELPGRPHGHCPECQLPWLSSLRQQLPCCLPQVLVCPAVPLASPLGARPTAPNCQYSKCPIPHTTAYAPFGPAALLRCCAWLAQPCLLVRPHSLRNRRYKLAFLSEALSLSS
jgi:hypothetical protein